MCSSDLGLGLGALFIRSLTLMLCRERALDQLVFLEHGAHYAIGALGGLMLAGIWLKGLHLHVPEWLTGLIGVVLLALSLMDSLRHRHRFGSPQGSAPHRSGETPKSKKRKRAVIPTFSSLESPLGHA